MLKRLLDSIRRFLLEILMHSAAMMCPEHYLGGGWEPEECRDCPLEFVCMEMK